MTNPINAPLLGTDSHGNIIPVKADPSLLAFSGPAGTQTLGLAAGANLGLASAVVALASPDSATPIPNKTIALSQWAAASRHGQLLPLAFVENNAAYGTVAVFASDARAIAAGFMSGVGYTVNQTQIAQAALTCSCMTGYGIDFGRDILVCTTGLNYPATPPATGSFPGYFVADGGGLLRQFDSVNQLSITSPYQAGLIQNGVVTEVSNVSGPTMRGMLLGTSYSHLQHFLTGKMTGNRRNKWAVQIGDWTGMNAPMQCHLNLNALPMVGSNTINLLDIPASAMGGCLINRRFIAWGSMITGITQNTMHGGYDVTLAPWLITNVNVAAIAAPIPPLWLSSAFQASPVGNVIYTDVLPPGYPVDFFIGSPLDMPPITVGGSTFYIVANSIVRSIGPNTSGAPMATGPWATSMSYAVNQVVTNLGNLYQMTATAPGMSSSMGIGPFGTGAAIGDGTCSWIYLGPNGYIMTLQPPSGTTNAITTTIPAGTILVAPPEVTVATGVCSFPTPNYQNSTMSSPGPVSFLPREWQGPAISLRANYTRLDDCEITGVAGANAVEILGTGTVLNDLLVNATSGTNGKVYAQGNSGGVLCSGGDMLLVNPNITSGDDCIAIGPKRTLVGSHDAGVLDSLTNIPIDNVTIINPTLVSYQARSIAAFLSQDNAQELNPWPTDPVNPPIATSNTLTFSVLPQGYNNTDLRGKGIKNDTYLAPGTTIHLVSGGPPPPPPPPPPPYPPYVARFDQNMAVIASGGGGKSYTMMVQSLEPQQTLTSGINVYVRGGSGISVGTAAGVGIINNNSSGEIVFDIEGYLIDMSYCISVAAIGFSSVSTFPSTIRMRGCHVRKPPGQAVALAGTHNVLDLDGNVFDSSSGTLTSTTGTVVTALANVQLWGISAGRIVGNRFGGAAAGNNVSVGGPLGYDILLQSLGNAVGNLDFGTNTYFGIANGGFGLDVAYANNVTFDGWSSFTQASPLGTGSGASAMRIDQTTSTGLYYDKFKFFVDGTPVVYLLGSGTFTTGFSFVPNAAGQLPVIALSALLTGLTSADSLQTLDGLQAPTPGKIGVVTMSGTNFYVRG